MGVGCLTPCDMKLPEYAVVLIDPGAQYLDPFQSRILVVGALMEPLAASVGEKPPAVKTPCLMAIMSLCNLVVALIWAFNISLSCLKEASWSCLLKSYSTFWFTALAPALMSDPMPEDTTSPAKPARKAPAIIELFCARFQFPRGRESKIG